MVAIGLKINYELRTSKLYYDLDSKKSESDELQLPEKLTRYGVDTFTAIESPLN